MIAHKLSSMRHVPFSKGSERVAFLRFHHHRKNHQTQATLTTPQIPRPPHQHHPLHLTAAALHPQHRRRTLLIPPRQMELFLHFHTLVLAIPLQQLQLIRHHHHIPSIQRPLLLLTRNSKPPWNGSTIQLYSGAILEKQSCKLSA
jgi:hypothetical protein